MADDFPVAGLVPNYRERFVWLDLGDQTHFNSRIASGIMAILNKMDKASADPIIFYICGIGGDFFAFLKLHYFIRAMRSSVAFVPFRFVKSGCFYITQSGVACAAMPGTKFTFHRAVDRYIAEKNETMNQEFYLRQADRLRIVDTLQLMLFVQRGRPISEVFKLFLSEATLSVAQAQKVKLVDAVYSEKDFRKDRAFVLEFLKKTGRRLKAKSV